MKNRHRADQSLPKADWS